MNYTLCWKSKLWTVTVPQEVPVAFRWPYVQKFVVSGHTSAMVFVTELQYPGIGFAETGPVIGFAETGPVLGFAETGPVIGFASVFKPVSAFFSACTPACAVSVSASDTSLSRTNFQTQRPRVPLQASTGAASDTSISNTRPALSSTSRPSHVSSPQKSESNQKNQKQQRFSKHFAKPHTGGHRGSGPTNVVKRPDNGIYPLKTQSPSGNPIQ